MSHAITRHLALSIAMALLAGCSQSDAPSATAASPAPVTKPVFTVLGIDRTAGNAMARQGLAIAHGYVLAAKPCDRLQLRWISDRSFVSSEVIGDLRLPCLPKPAAEFDAAATRRYVLASKAIQVSRRDAIAALDAYAAKTLAATRSSDLVGFIAATSTSFADAPEYDHALAIISDFEDNAKRSATVDLDQATVTMHLVGEQANPERAQALTTAWSDALKKMGAASVRLRSEAPEPYLPATSR